MVDMQNVRRAEARRRRALAALGADEKERAKHLRIKRALQQIRVVLADHDFIKLAYARGCRTIPNLLLYRPKKVNDESLDFSLDFVVAWRFFSPLLHDPLVAELLDHRWPGFGLELRDVFISIVSDGPFPLELRGRSRRTI